jgi:hypothetical protein
MTGDAMSGNASTVAIASDLVVNQLGYGAMRLTGPGMWGEYPDRDTPGRACAGGVEPAGISLPPACGPGSVLALPATLTW